mgnify:CR=1 FL=1
MKKLIDWFKASSKLKRWMLLVLIGIILISYAFSQIWTLKEISFIHVGIIVLSFVLGFTAAIIGLISIQKRTLEISVKSKDKKENINIKPLVFKKDIYEDGPKVVAIGGGDGLNVVLEGIKKYTNNITAIVTVSDYGQTVSDSRKELELLPIEDIKNGMIALSEDEDNMKNVINHQFKNERLRGLTFGDVYMLALRECYGNLAESVQKSCKILNITGKVLPVTLDEFKICAELEDGTVIDEKDKIPQIVYEKVSKINRIFINPTNCLPAPGVLEAIADADAIVIGPR